jgi:ABC-2 type transport system ATP-binding protein
MDPEGTHEILSFLREKVRNDGLTIFISSHLMSEIEEFCDAVFVINHGRLVASGKVKDILQPHERIVRVTFRDKVPEAESLLRYEQIRRLEAIRADTLEITLASGDAAWLNERLLRDGFKISALTPKQKTLKEFFLSITGDRQ